MKLTEFKALSEERMGLITAIDKQTSSKLEEIDRIFYTLNICNTEQNALERGKMWLTEKLFKMVELKLTRLAEIENELMELHNYQTPFYNFYTVSCAAFVKALKKYFKNKVDFYISTSYGENGRELNVVIDRNLYTLNAGNLTENCIRLHPLFKLLNNDYEEEYDEDHTQWRELLDKYPNITEALWDAIEINSKTLSAQQNEKEDDNNTELHLLTTT